MTALIRSVAALALTAAFSAAAENPPAPAAGLPSAPGPHIGKIRALGENAWLDLNSPAPDPKWGKARGRAWGPRMVHVPKLRAAFLMGQGVHAAMKENGIYEDDAWLFAYDANADKWEEKPRPLCEKMAPRPTASFYDPELGVHFFHSAHDSKTTGGMYVYRFRNTAK